MSHTSKILIAFNPDFRAAIDFAAKVNHCSRSEYIRAAVRNQLKRETAVPISPVATQFASESDNVVPITGATTTAPEPEEYTATVV